eukprot:7380107-Prymnesium_polylepis.4
MRRTASFRAEDRVVCVQLRPYAAKAFKHFFCHGGLRLLSVDSRAITRKQLLRAHKLAPLSRAEVIVAGESGEELSDTL